MEEDAKKNLRRSGEYLMYSIWIQNQLSDLIIINRNKEIIESFNNTELVPDILRQERYSFWEKDFREIKEVFENEFSELLTLQAKADLDSIYYFRNAIAHSNVSIGRKYLLYKPKTEKILENIKKSLNIINKNDVRLNYPEIIKIDFSNDSLHLHNFNAIKRLDEIFIKDICNKLGINHLKIR